MSEQTELKPCPFCGGPGTHWEEEGSYPWIFNDRYGCRACYVGFREAEKWNRRAQVQSPEAPRADEMDVPMKVLTRNGQYTFFGRYAPGDSYVSMRDIGIPVRSSYGSGVWMRMQTICGHPIPYIPDRGVIYFEGVGAIYRDGDMIHFDTHITLPRMEDDRLFKYGLKQIEEHETHGDHRGREQDPDRRRGRVPPGRRGGPPLPARAGQRQADGLR